MRNSFIDTITLECEKREDVFIITGDAGLGVLDQFQKKYPDRFLNLGVAEQNAMSMAAGIAISGFKVYLYNIIPFLLYRPYEQVRNDICYQNLPVVLVGIGSGITHAPAGMTHYSVEDLGIVQTLPGLMVLSPADPVEAKKAAEYSLECLSPLYVRLAKRGEPVIHAQEDFDITKPQMIKKGTGEIAILFHGSIADEVIRASRDLEDDNISPTVISIPLLQPLDRTFVVQQLREHKFIICVEEHFVNCGLGSMLKKLGCENKGCGEVITLGIDYEFIHEIGNIQQMRDFYNISSLKIAGKVRSLLE